MPPFTDVEPGVATYIDADFTKHAPHTRKKLDGYRNIKEEVLCPKRCLVSFLNVVIAAERKIVPGWRSTRSKPNRYRHRDAAQAFHFHSGERWACRASSSFYHQGNTVSPIYTGYVHHKNLNLWSKSHIRACLLPSVALPDLPQ